MPRLHHCRNILTLNEPGYGRNKRCSRCGSQVIFTNYYQKTAVCQAVVCSKCGKSKRPENHCSCIG